MKMLNEKQRGFFFIPTQAWDMARNAFRCHFSLSGSALHQPLQRIAGAWPCSVCLGRAVTGATAAALVCLQPPISCLLALMPVHA